mmetsp:Transcript_10001/g.25905  ORF Transcript_10001/g.25905 Transcript_10001/m.25905 type:complete len:310 (+) Transcript_10001:86-1015(+)
MQTEHMQRWHRRKIREDEVYHRQGQNWRAHKMGKETNPACLPVPDSCSSCVSDCPDWSTATSTRPPSCFFIDLGVEIVQSTLGFYGQTGDQACRYANLTSNGHFGRAWFENRVCPRQVKRSAAIFARLTWPRLMAAGFRPRQCRAILVEPNMQYGYDRVLEQFRLEYPNATVHERSAIYQCDAQALTFNGPQKSLAANTMKERWRVRLGLDSTDTRSRGATVVRALSLNRLLKETVTRADFVVLKVDVEASEYELLDCLASSPSMALVDQLLLERHDGMYNVSRDRQQRLDTALTTMRQAGIDVMARWP